MTLIIIILITLSIMGSSLWIFPPKQEIVSMKLRMKARKHNLTVQLTSIELPDKWNKSKKNHKLCSYSLHRDKPLYDWHETVWFLTYEVWKYPIPLDGWYVSNILSITEQTKQNLSELRDIITAVSISKDAVSVYWNENGDEKSLLKIIRLLHDLSTVR